ncbi:Hpt domain-containing protein [Pacificibacter sp. AS14]|uniref:Hpt domain-containing protein n=1 Tax=Pacificibacter sp. AS14 TaxID=3135785 RepID=UPI00316AF83F
MPNRKKHCPDLEYQIARTLQRTKQRFVDDFSYKIPEIEALQILIQNEAERSNALRRLAFITHQFGGIAATLSLQDIGDCAAEIEQLIAGFNQTPMQLCSLSERIETLLDLMEDALVEAL